MGHFLSRKGTSLNAERSRGRGRPFRGKVPTQPPRSRSCFLRGPCMFCFLVHSASPPAPEETPPPPASRRDSPPPPLYTVALKAPEERSSRRLLHLSPGAAAWEQRGRRWLLSGLLFSPPPLSTCRGLLESAWLPGEAGTQDMVCKRKGVRLSACPPCKQPRCGTGAEPGAGGTSSTLPEAAVSQESPVLCASDCATEVSPKERVRENRKGKGLALSDPPSQVPEISRREKQELCEPVCEEPPENPGDCCQKLQPPSPDVNQLPSAVLLKVGLGGTESQSLCSQVIANQRSQPEIPKRKRVKLFAFPPCKQPRCDEGAESQAGNPSSPLPKAAIQQENFLLEQHLCPLSRVSDCATEVSPKDPSAENGDGNGPAPSDHPSQLPELGGRENQEFREPDCEEPPENPGDCCQELQPPSPDINQLPFSILLKIFSNLSLNERCLSASLVCKYWRDLCLDFQFWKQLDLSSRQQVTDELLERIASRSQNITEINISDCRNVSDTGVCLLAFKCPGLLRYTAYRCKQLSDKSIIAVASQCPQLQKVHVGNQDRLTDEGLKQLGSKCRQLKDIHFGQCYKISDKGMMVIAKGCLKLQRIYMQENKFVTDHSVKAFAEHCPELQYVGFMGCSVTSKGVIHLTNLRNLSSLDLRHITELDNETVMEIVKRCKNLTSLNLCLNGIINDRCVEVIAKEGQNLKELYLVSCKITDNALIAIGRYSMTIETVDVGWCIEITDQGATQIAQSSKSLRYLGLMRCDKVNEVTVEQLVQQHPHIIFSTVLQDCKRTLERAYQMGWTPNTSSAS